MGNLGIVQLASSTIRFLTDINWASLDQQSLFLGAASMFVLMSILGIAQWLYFDTKLEKQTSLRLAAEKQLAVYRSANVVRGELPDVLNTGEPHTGRESLWDTDPNGLGRPYYIDQVRTFDAEFAVIGRNYR